MLNSLISIIIPIFNAEKFLKKCLESVIKQSYMKIEIILVNDGSTDNSIDICLEYANKDKRIRVFNQDNKGGAAARNLGIKKANGDYIAFVDSDDFINKKYIELLYHNMVKYNAQLSVCGYNIVQENDDFDNKLDENINIETFDKSEAYGKLLDNNCGGYFGGKLFSKNKIYEMQMYINEEIYICEDFEFVARYLDKCDKLVFQNIKLYYYYKNSNSLTGNKNDVEKTITMINAYKSLEVLFKKNSPNFIEQLYFEIIKAKLNLNYRFYLLKRYNI